MSQPPNPILTTADVCNVLREGDEVSIWLGRRAESGTVPGALAAQLQHRIAMSESGAAKLQDLLVDLLRATPSPPPKA